MDTLLLLFLGIDACDPVTLKNGFGKQCVEIVEVYAPKPTRIPSKFGPILTGGMSCHMGDTLVGGQCKNRYFIVKK
jgi:hypothetical protein